MLYDFMEQISSAEHYLLTKHLKWCQPSYLYTVAL